MFQISQNLECLKWKLDTKNNQPDGCCELMKLWNSQGWLHATFVSSLLTMLFVRTGGSRLTFGNKEKESENKI